MEAASISTRVPGESCLRTSLRWTARSGFIPGDSSPKSAVGIVNRHARAAAQMTREIVAGSVERCFSQSLFKASAQGLPCFIGRTKNTGFDQEIDAWPRVEPQHCRPTQRHRLYDFPIGSNPGFHDRTQPGISRFHAPQPNLLEQLDNRIGLGNRGDRLGQRRLAGFGHRCQFIEQAPGPRGSPQLPQAPPPPGVGHPSVAPTPKAENCFSSFVALH